MQKGRGEHDAGIVCLQFENGKVISVLKIQMSECWMWTEYEKMKRRRLGGAHKATHSVANRQDGGIVWG